MVSKYKQVGDRAGRRTWVELIVADANLDVAAQISKAENLLAQGVKVLILSPVDAKALGSVVRQAKAAGVKVITEANPVLEADSYVGIDKALLGIAKSIYYLV